MEWTHPGGIAIGTSLAPAHTAVYETSAVTAQISGDVLPRARLTDRLAQAREALVLLAAPPGFGKTTLLRQWQAADERPFATVSIDAADNEPLFFWTRILEAVRRVSPQLDASAQIALHAPSADLLGVVIPLLAHDLRFVEHELVLALDDYQQIANPQCHQSLEQFLRWMPPNVTLALSTRSDPPIPLGTLRAAGDLAELRAVDLCFTEQEEATFLNGRLGLGLDDETMSLLHGRTEGWPAGVYLASLSLQKSPDRGAFVAGFNGSNRLIVDYLTEIALDALEPSQRQFLLETSILPSICAPLADAVTERTDSAELLGELERLNLFMVALDDAREWFRYHQLFADVLRGQLTRYHRDRLPFLHQRAARWYTDVGDTEHAIAQSVAGGDIPSAVELAASAWTPRLDRANARRTLRMLLPLEDEIRSDARLSLARSWSLECTNMRGEAAATLEAARQTGLGGALPDGTSLAAAAEIVEAFISRGDTRTMLVAAKRALRLRGDLRPAWRPLVHLLHGWARYLAGDQDHAEGSLQSAKAAASELGQWENVAVSQALLARVALKDGENDLAEARARDAVAVVEANGTKDELASGFANMALGSVLARRKPGEASRYLSRGLVRLRAHGEPLLLAEALLAVAPVRRVLQGAAQGRACIDEARELIDTCRDPGVVALHLEDVARSLTPSYRRAGEETELTERELEVLRYLANGLSKREIGQALFLSYNTIHSHTKSIYQKLRVSSRGEAVAKGNELGVL
jgi:LuxR family transcriptional regulator, maltose regulon positive regulatory protein